MEPGKKISFGFSKSSKKVPVIQNKTEEKKVELIECFEGQSIRIKDAVAIIDEPLVIPIRDNKKNLLDRVRDMKESRDNEEPVDNRPNSELTLDELAARELINDAKKRLSEKLPDNKVHLLPMKSESISLEGEKESTLEDYEKIPISDYGLAMLRGMGWKDGMGIGKSAVKTKVAQAPELRPKGLGLGANKMVKSELSKAPVCDKEGRVLTLKRGALAKIIAGTHKGNYCEVQGLDDETCRVIVRTALKGEILTLNEFLVIPVTKEEYSKCSKVLNMAQYEEYKKKEELKMKKEEYKKEELKMKKEEYKKEEFKIKKEVKHEKTDRHSRKHYEKKEYRKGKR